MTISASNPNEASVNVRQLHEVECLAKVEGRIKTSETDVGDTPRIESLDTLTILFGTFEKKLPLFAKSDFEIGFSADFQKGGLVFRYQIRSCVHRLFESEAPDSSMKLVSRAILLVIFAFISSPGIIRRGYAAQNSGDGPIALKRAVAVRITDGIQLDGLLNEAAWASSPNISEILQREPREGVRPSEETEVRLLFDDDNLYIGVLCYDSESSGIIATQMARDATLSSDDRVEILLDTFLDRRNAFYFATNPAGALVDGLIIENGQTNLEWDAIWDVRARRTDEGWSAEFAIPFKSLNFNQNGLQWGFNFSRTIRRKTEEVRWAAARLDIRFTQVSEAGEIDGLFGLEQGRGLDIRPYSSGTWVYTPTTTDLSARGTYGADIFYNITPSLKLTGTVNTDFAETEVDNRQINLTRFPLFFPEKRAFFLENAGVFSFGGGGGNELIPFFSRRIGLLEGREVPILAGLKLAGKVGRYDVGVLDMRTRETRIRRTPIENILVEPKNFFVGRVKRNIWTQSYVGGIYTEGNPSAPLSARTYGADVRLGTSRFLGGRRNFSVDGYVLRVDNEDVKDKNSSYALGVSYPNDTWNLGIDWRKIEANFKPALGFVQRSDISRINTTSNFRIRPRNLLGLRQIFFQFMVNRFVRLDHRQVENWRIFTAPVHLTWNSGDRFEVNVNPTFERLFQPFPISRNVTLPPGDYRFTRKRVEFFTSPNRPWKIDTTWWFGAYWSGKADQLTGQFQYKWAPHVDTSFRYDQTFARLKEGDFTARIFTLRSNYSFSPLLAVSNLAQYDNDSKNVGWQSRVRWILQPGREIFLVFNLGWVREVDSTGETHFRAADRGVAAKAQYTLRF